jgi:uncharacterized RDD family membrane protein YckC
MNKSQKKTTLITSLTLIATVVSTILYYIANHIYEHYAKAGDYKGWHEYLCNTMFSISVLLKPLWYDLPSYSWYPWEHIFGPALPVVNAFPWLLWGLLLTGLILYIVKKGKEVRLLRFVFAVYFFFMLVYLIIDVTNIYMLCTMEHNSDLDMTLVLDRIVSIASNIIWVIIAAIVLNELKKSCKVSAVVRVNGDTMVEEMIVAPKWKRLIHTIIDGTILSFLVLIVLNRYILFARIMHKDTFTWIVLSGVLLQRSLYYLIQESVWSATPAKFITGTTVRDENGEKATFRQILGRTLSRLIPFDAWSFFGWRGWHDRFSDTWVCKEEIQDEKTDSILV